jgi:alcohol dehydrogenase class IV
MTAMMPFLQVPRVVFDHGAIGALPTEIALLGVRRPLLLTDQGLVRAGVFEKVLAVMPSGASFVRFENVPENPTVAGVEAAFAMYGAEGCDGIVAVGGGSVMDTGKAVAVLSTHPGPLADYLNRPDRITRPMHPLIAVPTTAGTGSEASRGAGIHPTETARSLGLNSPFLVPRVAICDPDLTLTLPAHLTAATGMDALSHCVEGFLATANNPVLDAVALDGTRRVFEWVERATADGQDREARWHLMLAALQGGMSIPKGLGPVHALAITLGDQGLHHGLLVTLAMPHVLRLHARHVPEKMRVLAEVIGVASGAEVADEVEAMNTRLGLPSDLKAMGYKVGDLDEMAADSVASYFNKASPYQPSQAEYKAMLMALLGV